jgi:cyclohexyl-isocyanide hydratase
MDFVRRRGARATWVTSVCTGAFVLGAAGLLKGRRATTHWAYTGLLPLVGATYAEGRVVRDGNIFTGGGVTAGIDFALAIAAEIAGPEVAGSIAAAIEYDPPPASSAGPPDRALAAIRERLAPRYEATLARYRAEFGRTSAA